MNISPSIVWALTISLIIHGIFLKTSYYDEPKKLFAKKTMEIILVNSKTLQAPINSNVLAQANLNGGGSTDENLRVQTPFPVLENSNNDSANISVNFDKPKQQQYQEQAQEQQQQLQEKIQNLELQQQQLFSELKRKSKNEKQKYKEATKNKNNKNNKDDKNQNLSADDLILSAKEFIRLEGEIAQRIQKYNQRPRRKFIGATAKEVNYAAYLEAWRQKIERLGTINYPANARGKIYGSLMLSVAIRKNGSIEKVRVMRSSGHKILDEAALRIIKLGEPYARFPADIAAETDVIEINRWWKFTKDDEFR